MRRVDRGTEPAPAALSAVNRKGETELQRAEAHFQNPALAGESFEFSVYKADEVKLRLETLFHGKCAYCETFYAAGAPLDVEHYRPKGAVEGETHPGYWWIAMDWANLLPSCIDCNRRRYQVTPRGLSSLLQLRDDRFTSDHVRLSGKKDAFPIAGVRAMPSAVDFTAERAILLDPTRDDPSEHLEYYIDPANLIGLVLPRAGQAGDVVEQIAEGDPAEARSTGASVRGAVSIQVYGLNRLRLVQERTRVLRQLEFLEGASVELGRIIDKIEAKAAAPNDLEREIVEKLAALQDRILKEMLGMTDPTAPYSVMAKQYVDDFIARVAAV